MYIAEDYVGARRLASRALDNSTAIAVHSKNTKQAFNNWLFPIPIWTLQSTPSGKPIFITIPVRPHSKVLCVMDELMGPKNKLDSTFLRQFNIDKP
jgi:hypothetical protein